MLGLIGFMSGKALVLCGGDGPVSTEAPMADTECQIEQQPPGTNSIFMESQPILSRFYD